MDQLETDVCFAVSDDIRLYISASQGEMEPRRQDFLLASLFKSDGLNFTAGWNLKCCKLRDQHKILAASIQKPIVAE